MNKLFTMGALAALALGCGQAKGPQLGPDLGKADGVAPECSFNTAFAAGEDSQDLALSIVSGREVSADDIDDLSEIETKQLIATGVQLGFFDSTASVEDAFDAADEGLIEILELEFEEAGELHVFDWVRYFAGDNEVGVLFDDETRTVVAEVSDGDVLGCVQKLADPFVCLFDSEFVGGETSSDLQFFVVGGLEFTASDDLDDTQKAQLAAAANLEEADGDLFDAADEGTVEFLDLEIETVTDFVAADWVRYFAGDTEVGVVFEAGTANIIAEVSDGDVLACFTQQTALDNNVNALLSGKGLTDMSVIVDAVEVALQVDFGANVPFETALDRGLDALLTSSDDPESPLSLVMDEIPLAGDSCLDTTNAKGALACVLGESGSLRLAKPGESIQGPGRVQDDWVFVVTTDLSDHVHWVVVNRADPAEAVLVFGFN